MTFVSATQFHVYLPWCLKCESGSVAAFNQEKAFSVIVQLHRLIVYSTSVCTCAGRGSLCMTERCRCGLSLVTGGTGTAPAGPGPASVLVQRPTYHRHLHYPPLVLPPTGLWTRGNNCPYHYHVPSLLLYTQLACMDWIA